MKKEIEFRHFGEEATIYFNIKRLSELEVKTKKPIASLVNTELSIELILVMLQIGLQHVYGLKSQDFYSNKIEEFLENDGHITKIWADLLRALLASGILGKESAKKAVDNKLDEMVDTDIEKN